MKKISPAVLAAAMLAGASAYAQTSGTGATAPTGAGSVTRTPAHGSTGVNAGTAEGEGRLSGQKELIVPGKGREEPVGGATGLGTQPQTQSQADRKKEEDARKRRVGS
jgi:hypothetical protein